MRGDFSPKGHLALYGGGSDCHDLVGVGKVVVNATGILQCTGQPLTIRSDLAKAVSSALVDERLRDSHMPFTVSFPPASGACSFCHLHCLLCLCETHNLPTEPTSMNQSGGVFRWAAVPGAGPFQVCLLEAGGSPAAFALGLYPPPQTHTPREAGSGIHWWFPLQTSS